MIDSQIFQIPYMNIHEKVFPRSKFAIFFPRNLKNPKSAKIKLHKNLLPQGFRRCGNCERFCLSCNLSAFVSRFQNHAFGNCVNFSGKKVTAPPQVPKCPHAHGQGDTLNEAVVDFPASTREHMHYVGLSCVRNSSALHILKL